jgi:SAM-dependent methyltransferase
MDLKEVDLLGEGIARHWYYRSKLAALLRLLRGTAPRRALDVGAGSGFFARALLERTALAEATCFDPFYESDRDETVAGKPLRFRRDADAAGADLVLLMDVLEHVDDDVGLLAAQVAAAPPGAEFVISVPAFGWLWSGHDVFLGHRRRYTLDAITDVARRAGLRTTQGAYYFGLVLPLAAVSRLPDVVRRARGQALPAQSQMRNQGALANAVLAAVCAAELPLLRFNRVAGLTVFLRARKP